MVKRDGIWIQMIYLEIIKNRSGKSDITIPMENNLHLFDFEEMDKNLFTNLCEMYKSGQEPEYDSQLNLF